MWMKFIKWTLVLVFMCVDIVVADVMERCRDGDRRWNWHVCTRDWQDKDGSNGMNGILQESADANVSCIAIGINILS